MIGYVPQDTLLLHDTIMRNVTFGDSELTERNVEDALRAAGAWDFVMTKPQGGAQYCRRTRREAVGRAASAHCYRESART